MMKTKVKFLINEKDTPDLFAYFPFELYDGAGRRTAYSTIGQHSACSPEYANESREAQPYEYKNLKIELESIGYELEILNK